MTRQLKLLACASVLMIFATGQNTTWCGCDLRPIVADIMDGTGCIGGCVDCGGCDDCDCLGCADCADCSSCGCDGCVIEKIPGTYQGPTAQNAAQVRLSSNAIGFFESMLRPMLGPTLSPMVLFEEEMVEVVPIPVVGDRTIRVCRGATLQNAQHCDIEFNIKRLEVNPQEVSGAPDRLRLLLEIQAWNTYVNTSGQRLNGWPMTLLRAPVCDWDDCELFPQSSDCVFSYDTRRAGPRDHIFVELVFSLGTSGVAPRFDINIIDVLPLGSGAGTGDLLGITPGPDSAQLSGNCQYTIDQMDGDLGTALTNSIILEVRDRLPRLVKGMLCEQRPNLLSGAGVPGVCPAPSVARDFTSAFPNFMPPIQGCGNSGGTTDLRTSNCLPILLGLEGRMDLGGLLGSVIPGYSALLDFIFAAANEATTPNSGLSVWMKGGIVAPTGHSDCVPVLPANEIPAVPSIPRAQVFQRNVTLSNRPTDILVGVSELFSNWAAYNLWDSGAFCIQIGSTTLPMLDPSLVGILFGTSLNALVFPASAANSPLGIGLRPQKPPGIQFQELDGEPGLRVAVDMPEVEIDFFAWSLDRYVRFVTFKMDVFVAVDVRSANNEVGVYLGDFKLANVSAKNDSLLANSGTAVTLLGTVVGGLIPSLLGDTSSPLFALDLGGIIPSEIDLGGTPLPLPLGIELREDAFGVVHVNASGGTVASRDSAHDTLMGIFVDFTTGGGGGSGLTAALETSVEVTSLYIPDDHSGFQAETFGEGELPRVEFIMNANAPAGVPLEYRHRLALGGWSAWQDSPYGVIESPLLLLQQEHIIMARARVKGDPRSEDKSSGIAKVRVDVTPPMIELTEDASGVRLQAVDLQTPIKNLQYRFRDPGGEFGDWTSFGDSVTALLDTGRDVEVEVRDESGNVASNVEALRGLPEPSSDGGCSCTVAGKPTSSGSTLGFLAMLAVLGGTFFRVRRRRHSA
jgi:MYXO-CTERM domain-containing protein